MQKIKEEKKKRDKDVKKKKRKKKIPKFADVDTIFLSREVSPVSFLYIFVYSGKSLWKGCFFKRCKPLSSVFESLIRTDGFRRVFMDANHITGKETNSYSALLKAYFLNFTISNVKLQPVTHAASIITRSERCRTN